MNSMNETPKFEIHQTLHGYSDGHRLIASSCKLPRNVESLMLILSDLSGPGGGDQFDSYLTGYPLESAGRYALACTWPAPEMGRPGCVWTHTLLLGEELLAEMNSPEEFMKLFRRPTAASDFDDYHRGMRVPELFGARQLRTRTLDDWTAWLGPRLLRAIYGCAAPFTVLSVPRYTAAEMPLLSTWRLQWPKLRASFTFCGGARAVRTLNGKQMSLQAALERDVRRLDRGPVPPTIVPNDSPDDPVEEWVAIASAAYSAPDTRNLVEFFNRIGCALPADPTLFRPAVTVYAILGHSPNADAVARDLVGYAATEFPEPTAGAEFKTAFLGQESPTGLPEAAVIRALAETDRHGAFDGAALKIRTRSSSLWEARVEAWELMSRLLTATGTPLSESILSGLIDAMPPEALEGALDAGGRVLEGFVRRSPQIAAGPLYWSPPVERQSRAARALLIRGDAILGLMARIIGTALNAGADPSSPDLVEVFGNASIPVILDWVDGASERAERLQTGWRQALRRKQGLILSWLLGRESVREETARLILSSVDIAAVFPDRQVIEALYRFLPIIETVRPERAAGIACAALKVALNVASDEAAELAAASFDFVYRAAMYSRLSDDSWWSLAHDLPQGYWWQEWDRCERLRKGVVERFRSKQWPASALIAVTRDDELFDTLVTELRDSWSGRRALREAIDSGASGRRLEVLMRD